MNENFGIVVCGDILLFWNIDDGDMIMIFNIE